MVDFPKHGLSFFLSVFLSIHIFISKQDININIKISSNLNHHDFCYCKLLLMFIHIITKIIYNLIQLHKLIQKFAIYYI